MRTGQCPKIKATNKYDPTPKTKSTLNMKTVSKIPHIT